MSRTQYHFGERGTSAPFRPRVPREQLEADRDAEHIERKVDGGILESCLATRALSC
jgi:hypothetical protein